MTDVTCRVSEERILAYVAAELGEDEELALAEHMAECRDCRDQAAEYTAISTALPEVCDAALVRWHAFESPFGTMHVAATDEGLVRISWRAAGADAFAAEIEARFPRSIVVRDPDSLVDAEREIREYFAGERRSFGLPVDLSSLGAFERLVLEEARAIGFGEIVPYSELARRIGRPGAARAVGNALGRNPVVIVVPCHRIVRSDRSIGGYGGGVEYKARLLELEGSADLLRAG